MNLTELQVWVEGFSKGLQGDRPPGKEQWEELLKVVAAAKDDEEKDVKESEKIWTSIDPDFMVADTNYGPEQWVDTHTTGDCSGEKPPKRGRRRKS